MINLQIFISIHFNDHIGISDPSASPAIATTQMLRTALISVTCVLSVMSVLTFIIGFVNTQITCLFNIVTQSLSYKKQQV